MLRDCKNKKNAEVCLTKKIKIKIKGWNEREKGKRNKYRELKIKGKPMRR